MAITREDALEIIEEIGHGVSLHGACRARSLHPVRVMELIDSDPALTEGYARADAVRADKYADEIIEISDTETCPQRARNRIDARKWSASKLRPKKYGERIDVNVAATLDIKGALVDARNRTAQLPSRYQQGIEDAEIVITKQLIDNSVAGSEPVDVAEKQDAAHVDPLDELL